LAWKILIMAANPSASPGPTHQENTSTWLGAGAAVAAGAVVGAGMAWVGAAAGGGTGVAAGPQADSANAAAMTAVNREYKNFLDM
jgi:hypothetical protein